MIAVGIDPGVSGAVAAISNGGALVMDIPTIGTGSTGRTQQKINGRALAEMLRAMVPAEEAAIVVLEDVHTMPSSHSGGSANSSLMHSKGVIEGVLSVLRLDVKLVSSQTWKRMYGVGSDKARALDVAKTMYPSMADQLKRQKDHNRAEALLMAHYAKTRLA